MIKKAAWALAEAQNKHTCTKTTLPSSDINPPPLRLSELDEVIGELNAIEETNMGLLALIGKIPVLLPSELGPQLAELIGRKIGILHLNGYRLRKME
ncbi:MAG: hypothetical protein MUO26_05415 [Methanotrichaceae archaeon]|nr:hypothetical protein [Methanotrichaceae archaeon]